MNSGNYLFKIINGEKKQYPLNSPFNPPTQYPEIHSNDTDPSNFIYEMVRDLLIKMELDKGRIGTSEWNPFGEFIAPGNRVVIKPNLVSEPRDNISEPFSIIVHPSILRPILDYCLMALNGEGELVIADAPQADSDFNKILELTNLIEMVEEINQKSKIKIKILDLRQFIFIKEQGVITERMQNNGDPNGYSIINLRSQSCFNCIEDDCCKIYGADYDYDEVQKHHSNNNHEYCVSKTILNADVIINVPKMKTHKKAGITVCLKNLVGINGNKNYLPHHRFGSVGQGGDEYPIPSLKNRINSSITKMGYKFITKIGDKLKLTSVMGEVYSKLSKHNIVTVQSGNWCGNDTIWRTILDLNTILFFADKQGMIQKQVQRKYFALVDGIIAGEENGPLFPKSKPCGVIIGGYNPVVIDIVSATIMGFNWKKIPQLVHGSKIFAKDFSLNRKDIDVNLKFIPPAGWENIQEEI